MISCLKVDDGFTALCLLQAVLNEYHDVKQLDLIKSLSQMYRYETKLVESKELTELCRSRLEFYVARQGDSLFLIFDFGVEKFGLPIPTISRCSYDYSLVSARLVQHELEQQSYTQCQVARLLTIGGGWACLRREEKAMECTKRLHQCAMKLGDQKLAQKCRLFCGWAFLWAGAVRQAIDIFQKERLLAVKQNDFVVQQQCYHALINATTNPTLQLALVQ